ncbi:MAG: type II toxin-antitoxin system RelE/ParE family toxin [Chitinophagales bacterium]
MIIRFTDFAINQLELIYSFISINNSVIIAQKEINKILERIELLATHPFIGNLEPNLLFLNKEHRFIVVSNYKIIYKILDSIIYIFDCRQSPDKVIIRNK